MDFEVIVEPHFSFFIIVEFYRCWFEKLIISMIDGCLIELYNVDLLILVDNNSEKLLICYACLRCPFSCNGQFLPS